MSLLSLGGHKTSQPLNHLNVWTYNIMDAYFVIALVAVAFSNSHRFCVMSQLNCNPVGPIDLH